MNGESGKTELQQTRELAIINAIAQALNRTLDLNQALQTTLAHTAELFGLHSSWIWLINERNGKPYLAAAQNLPPGLEQNPRAMEGSCYCLDTYRSGDLNGAANVNVIKCSRLSGLIDGTDGLRYHASIPLYAQGKQLGVLNVASGDWRQLSAHDLQLLYTVGDMLSIALERAALFASSTQLGALEERNRLAREIHDTLAQGLSAIALQLETADALLDTPNQTNPNQLMAEERDRIQAIVQQALKLARNNLDEARRSVLDLRAAPLEGRSLMAALDAFVHAQKRTDFRVTFSAVGGTHPLPVTIESGLYRIAQEAFNNIHAHAAATRVRVELVTTPATVTLRIEDNGRGFDQECANEHRFGLTGMTERARLLGGTLSVESEPGEGTRVTVSVPIGKGH